MFTPDMDYSTALKIVADAYATKPKEDADEIYKEYQRFSDDILHKELSFEGLTMTSNHYDSPNME